MTVSFWGRAFAPVLGVLVCAGAFSRAHAQDMVTGEVHWDQSQGRSVSPYAYGANVWQGFDPNIAGNPGSSVYKNRMADMRPGMVRYHSWEMLGEAGSTQRGWLNNASSDTPTWNQTKIGNALSGAYSYGPQVMMNIPKWPDAWNESGNKKLRADRYTQFATYCADLVRVVNVNLGKNVVYWEVMNEPDDFGYNGKGDFQEVGRIYAQAAAAMKSVDGSIKIGGPAFARGWKEQADNVNGFLDTAGNNLSFISYHGYGTFDTNLSITSLYDAARDAWAVSYWVDVAVRGHGLNIERFHNEINVNGNQYSGNIDYRTTNEKGLIFNTLSLLTLATSGYTTGNAVWNESDGWYGLMDADTNYTPRPAYYGVKLLNDDGKGEIKTVSGFDTSKVCAFALQSGNYVKLFLVNRAQADVVVKAPTISGLPSYTPNTQKFTRKVAAAWNGGGVYYPGDVSLAELQSGFVLSADTVTELILDTGTIPSVSASLSASVASAPGSVNFSAEGTYDWIHFGNGMVGGSNRALNRKSGANRISDFSLVNAANSDYYGVTNGAAKVSWSSGTPTATASNTQSGLSVYKWWTNNVGYRFTVPADTTARTLKLYAGTYNSKGVLTATLSGGGVPAKTAILSGEGYTNKDACFTVAYKAASAGQTLTVEFVNTDNLGGYSPSETRLFGVTVQ